MGNIRLRRLSPERTVQNVEFDENLPEDQQIMLKDLSGSTLMYLTQSDSAQSEAGR